MSAGDDHHELPITFSGSGQKQNAGRDWYIRLLSVGNFHVSQKLLVFNLTVFFCCYRQKKMTVDSARKSEIQLVLVREILFHANVIKVL